MQYIKEIMGYNGQAVITDVSETLIVASRPVESVLLLDWICIPSPHLAMLPYKLPGGLLVPSGIGPMSVSTFTLRYRFPCGFLLYVPCVVFVMLSRLYVCVISYCMCIYGCTSVLVSNSPMLSPVSHPWGFSAETY